MPRKSAQLRQADIRRAIAAGRQAGAAVVELHGGAVIIRLLDSPPLAPAELDADTTPVVL